MNDMTSAETTSISGVSPWRRIAAFLIDYLLVMIPYLGVLSLCGWALWSLEITPSFNNPYVGQVMIILVLTLPIVMYFALTESSRWKATVGKKLMNLAVVDCHAGRATFKQTAIRAIVKFLPWEFFHTIYWHWDGWPTDPAPPTNLQIFAMTVGYIVIGCFVLSLFVGTRRTPYDRVAGTTVVPSIRRH